ncbi:MAG: STAS domain-containing protein, partial [Ignavibacteriae bacterium]
MIVFLPRAIPKLPGSLVAIIVTTAAVAIGEWPVETVGSRFGEVSGALPSFAFPTLDWATVTHLFSPALSIALLAGIESLLSAVVADGMTGRRHRSNTELIAQGVANIASPLFGGIPATGAIARTATNVKSGAVSPIAGIIHAAVLFVILIAAGKWAALIPLPTLAGILLVVAYNMSELHLFGYVLKSTRSDAMVLLTTFLLTVFVDLTVAIQVGVVLAAFLFMKRMADVAQVRALTGLLDDGECESGMDPHDAELLRQAPEGVEVFEVNGPFFFGAAHKFQHALSEVQRTPKVIVLRMRNVLALDATGLRVLEESLSVAKRGGPKLLLSEVHSQPVIL